MILGAMRELLIGLLSEDEGSEVVPDDVEEEVEMVD